MWASEIENYYRFTGRGRLIVGATAAILAFASAAVFLGSPEDIIKAATSVKNMYLQYIIRAMIVLGAVLILFGLLTCILSAARYIIHAEEDSGYLSKKSDFRAMNGYWWLRQPTAETVEEYYFMRSLIHSLPWKTRRLGYYHPGNLIQRASRSWHKFLLFLAWRSLAKSIENAPVNTNNTQNGTEAANAELQKWLKDVSGDRPIRHRGPYELAALGIGLHILKEEYRRKDTEFEQAISISNKIRMLVKDIKNKKHTAPTAFLPKIKQRPKDKRVASKLEMLSPEVLVKSSSYYMQFSEEHAYLYAGGKYSAERQGIPKAPIAKRQWIDFDESSARKDARKKKVPPTFLDANDWRVLTSVYYAAQDLRSTNWNVWYRVKISERLFVYGVLFIVCGFAFSVFSFATYAICAPREIIPAGPQSQTPAPSANLVSSL